MVTELHLYHLIVLTYMVQVLRVVNEPPSPALSRKSSSSQRRPNQGPPSFLHTDDHGDTFLQVISYTRTTMGTP